MADATAITPERAGYGGLKAIDPGSMQIKQALATATTTRNEGGVMLDEVRVRCLALGMPLWDRTVNKQEMSWIMRQPGTARGNRRGVTHGCAHNAKKGQKENCIGGHDGKGASCSFTFKSVGDGVTRWRNDPKAHEIPAFDGDNTATIKAAREQMQLHIAALLEKKFSKADMEATKSIKWMTEHGIVQDSMYETKKRKTTAKAKKVSKPKKEKAK